MMTVSGTAAEGPPAADETRRIAVDSVSPQLVAVMGPDTEKRLAVIPVMSYFCFEYPAAKVINFLHKRRKNIEEIFRI